MDDSEAPGGDTPATASPRTSAGPWGSPRHGNWIVRHWRGELSLAASYWLNGFLGNIAAVTLAAVLGLLLQNSREPWLSLAGIAAVWGFLAVVTVWQYLGVWRSASRTAFETGRAFWPRAAKLLVILGLISGGRVAFTTAVPQLDDTLRYATGDRDRGPRGIRILRDGTELEIVGFFAYGLAQDFAASLARNPAVRTVHLTSPGGRVTVALDIRDAIRAHGLDTYTSADCASACTIAYLAGRQRFIVSGARLGFHRFSFPGASVSLINQELRQTYSAAGLSSAFIDHIEATPPDRLWAPSTEELIAAGAVTAQRPSGSFALSGFGLVPDAETIEKRLLAYPVYDALRLADPAGWQVVRDAWIHAVEDGQPQTEAAGVTRARLAVAALRLRPVMPDDAAVAFANAMVRETKAIQAADPEACWVYVMKGGLDILPYLSAELREQDLAMTTKVLTGAAQTPAPPITKEEGAALRGKIVASLVKSGQDAALVASGLAAGAPHDKACPALWRLYEAALALPDGEAGPAIRYLVRG
jgi:hypothetical protein